MITVGPDGNLYIADGMRGEVLRYDRATGQLLGVSASAPTPTGVAFGPDGHLYVSSINTDTVLRFDGTTGALINTFISPGLGGLDAPQDLMFGPDGNLYVVSDNGFNILRFRSEIGEFIDKFVQDASGRLHFPIRGFTFGPDDALYATYLSQVAFGGDGSSGVARFDGTTGEFVDFFVRDHTGLLSSGSGPADVAFGPDGKLYVVGQNNIVRYEALTGSLVDVFISGGMLDSPNGIAFGRSPLQVPEPPVLPLCALGLLAIFFRGGRTSASQRPRATRP